MNMSDYLKKNRYITHVYILSALVVFLSGCSSLDIAKDEVFDPGKSFTEANELMKDGYYKKAREVLEEIRAKDASQQYATLARVRIADAFFEEGSYEEAVVEYESFLDLHPYHKYASYAKYKLAMCYYSRIETVDVSYSWAKKALGEFRELRQRYPRNPYMNITEIRMKTCRNILAGYELYVAKFYFKKGSFKAASTRLVNMLKKFPDSGNESEALYYLGISYMYLGQRESAIDTFGTLIEKYPTIGLTSRAREIFAAYKKMPYLVIPQ